MNTPNQNKKNKSFSLYRGVKRCFDFLFSLLVVIILSPVFFVIALVIKFSDGGPIFFAQERIGKNGKPFKLYKFRSMVANADCLEQSLSPEEYEDYKKEYKLTEDGRITKVGAFLRKTSLDELPNLFSVLKGDISIVGPRPLLQEEIDTKFIGTAEKLLSMKPGMVGMWAVNGRSNLSYENGERQEMELYYIDHCNVLLDIQIMAKAVLSVLRQDGAK